MQYPPVAPMGPPPPYGAAPMQPPGGYGYNGYGGHLPPGGAPRMVGAPPFAYPPPPISYGPPTMAPSSYSQLPTGGDAYSTYGPPGSPGSQGVAPPPLPAKIQEGSQHPAGQSP